MAKSTEKQTNATKKTTGKSPTKKSSTSTTSVKAKPENAKSSTSTTSVKAKPENKKISTSTTSVKAKSPSVKSSARNSKSVSPKLTNSSTIRKTESKKKDNITKQIEQSNREIFELLKPMNEITSDSKNSSEITEKNKKKKIGLIIAISLFFVILVIFLLVKSCTSSDREKNRERQNTIALAKRYMEKGQFEPAMELLNKLLILDAEDQEVSKLLDELIELKTDQDFENQNGLSGNYDLNFNTDSITNAFRDTLDSMNKELSAANEANTKNQETLSNLLETQRQEEQERQAQAIALEKQKNEEEAKRKAQEEELAKQNKQVQEEIQKVNDLIEQGNAKLGTGKNSEALKDYQDATKLLPISKGEPNFSASKYSQIASNLYEAAQKEKDSTTKSTLMDNAVSYATKALEKDSSNPNAHFILAMDAENKQDAQTSERELELAVKNDPNNYLYYFYLGRRQQIDKKYSQARSSYNSSIKINPNFDSAHFNLGLTCNRLNLPKEALASFRKAYSVNPQHAKAYLEEARLLRKGFNDLDGAINAYNKVLTIEPDNMSALKECGSVYAETANYAKAENCFRRVIARLGNAEDPMTYYNLSTVLYNQSKITDALKYAEQAYNTKDSLRTSAEKAMIVYQYALTTEKAKDTLKAISLYREVLTLNPSHTKAKINLGIMFMEMDPPDVDTALSFLTSAYQEDKNNFEVNNNLGNAYLLKKDYINAVNFYLNASKIKPKDTEVKINLAKAYTESSQFDNAKVIFIDVINQNPDSYDSYIDLAKVCIALHDTISAEGYLTALQTKKPEYKASEVKSLLDTVRLGN